MGKLYLESAIDIVDKNNIIIKSERIDLEIPIHYNINIENLKKEEIFKIIYEYLKSY